MSIQEHEKRKLGICFALFVSNKAYKLFRSAKKCGFFRSVFKKIIPNNITPTFQEVGGLTKPLTFCRWHENFSWYRVNHHKIG